MSESLCGRGPDVATALAAPQSELSGPILEHRVRTRRARRRGGLRQLGHRSRPTTIAGAPNGNLLRLFSSCASAMTPTMTLAAKDFRGFLEENRNALERCPWKQCAHPARSSTETRVPEMPPATGSPDD